MINWFLLFESPYLESIDPSTTHYKIVNYLLTHFTIFDGTKGDFYLDSVIESSYSDGTNLENPAGSRIDKLVANKVYLNKASFLVDYTQEIDDIISELLFITRL